MKTCKTCGADISDMSARTKYCKECRRERIRIQNRQWRQRQRKARVCKLCGADISDRGTRAMYCLECTKLQREKQRKIKNAPDRVDRKQCKTCIYRSGNQEYACNYISITGQTRGCPPSPNCTKYQKGKRIQKEWSLIYSMRGEFE